MPPEVAPVPFPTTYGIDAQHFLQAHGMMDVVPSIRSSDDELLANPFMYYLTRRLGVASAFSSSQAANRGTWFHAFLGLKNDPLIADKANILLEHRIRELKEIGKTLGVGVEAMSYIVHDEKQDFGVAAALWEASKHIIMREDRGTYHGYFDKSHWRLLGTEVLLAVRCPVTKNIRCVTIDQLWYHVTQKRLWILDCKTCDFSPKVRAQTVAIEFQTWHYLHTVKELLDVLIRQFELDVQTQVGGMFHLIVQRPSIIFGQRDCNLLYYESEGKKTGVKGRAYMSGDKAMVKTSKSDVAVTGFENLEEAIKHLHKETGKTPVPVRAGEPSLDNYTKRCIDWALARGEYAKEAEERSADPVVNLTDTDAPSVFSAQTTERYHEKLKEINMWATCPAYPGNFPQRTRDLRMYGKLSSYAPFFLCPIHQWPEIIRRERFTLRHRDEDLWQAHPEFFN